MSNTLPQLDLLDWTEIFDCVKSNAALRKRLPRKSSGLKAAASLTGAEWTIILALVHKKWKEIETGI